MNELLEYVEDQLREKFGEFVPIYAIRLYMGILDQYQGGERLGREARADIIAQIDEFAMRMEDENA